MPQTKKPNVIWVISDQHRASALSCNGDGNLSTPHIDILANMGINFTGAVGGFPLCCPFRGSMLTGIYPHKCVPGHEYQMPPEQKTIAHVFNENGYDTAYIGKWHLDGHHERESRAALHVVPPERRGGFKYWVGYENNNLQYDCYVHGGEGDNAFMYRLPGYETDELTNLLIKYIDEQQDKPFFAVLSVQPPHNPYIAPPEFMQRHVPENVKLRPNVPNIKSVVDQSKRELAGMYAMIENLDYNVGRIVESLKQNGIADDTHIMFFSDHGDMHGSHGQFHKTSPFEEAIRIPFVIGGERPRYEGRLSGRFNVPINHVDIAPTTLGLCGIDAPDSMEGHDYSHYRLQSRKTGIPEPDSAFIQSVIPTGHANSVDKPWRGVITRDGWKYVCFEGIAWVMFNLNDDPYEQMNLAHNSLYKNKRKELNDRLKRWIDETGDKFALPVYL